MAATLVPPLPDGDAPPSRDANPFATCWTRPGALPWIEAAEHGIDAVVERLRESHWRGQIVGPHGAGKSTLLNALGQPLIEAGKRPILIDTLHAGPTREQHTAGEILLMEGFERLTWLERYRWLRHLRRSAAGVLVTSHRPIRPWRCPVPVVATMRPGEPLLRDLFEQLTHGRPTPVMLGDAIASFSRRAGNLRDVWFDLYNLHEQRVRSH